VGGAGGAPKDAAMHDQQPRGFTDFLSFRSMMTPLFIQPIWLAGSAFLILYGLISSLVSGEFLQILGALVGIAFGLVIWRVCCELLLTLFRIHDALDEIRKGDEHELEPALRDIETSQAA
jgi:hypothetical protein